MEYACLAILIAESANGATNIPPLAPSHPIGARRNPHQAAYYTYHKLIVKKRS